MSTPLVLTVLKGTQQLFSKTFEMDIIKIGRATTANLCIEDDKLARIHAVIDIDADGVMSITHMGGEEGTFVNGRRVHKAVVSFGDEIRMGGTTVQVGRGQSELTGIVNLATAEMTGAHRSASPALRTVAAQSLSPKPPDVVLNETTGVQVRGRPPRRKGSGPSGLEIRMMWGSQMVANHFLPPNRTQAFTVGTGSGVDFVMGDSKLGTEKFEAVKADGSGFVVRFTGKMKGELHRNDGRDVMDLEKAVASGVASNDGSGYVISLKEGDFAWVDLGSVVMEVCFQPVPKPVLVPYWETIDFTALNIFLTVFFIGALFVIWSVHRDLEGDELADDLNANQARLTKLLVKPNEKNPLLQKLAKQKESGEKAEKHRKDEGKMGKKDAPNTNRRTAPKGDPNNKDQARMITDKLFGNKSGGMSTIFGRNGIGGELQQAMGGMFGAAPGDSGGLGGMGLRGSGSGGGGSGNTIGIGGVGSKGRGSGTGNYGTGTGGFGGKKGVDIGITSTDLAVTGSLDKELIRQVIRRNVGQIRYCYESQLSRFPNLNGKVAVRFIISANGSVAQSQVAQSTVNNSELETCVAGRVRTWQFPEPKGGGVVVVTYPFIFKQSGE